MTPNPLIFAPLLFASLAVFLWGFFKRLGLISLGQPEDRLAPDLEENGRIARRGRTVNSTHVDLSSSGGSRTSC